MAKDKKLLVAFDMDIANVPGNQAAFTVTGTRYKYVGGPLVTQTYPVLSTDRPVPPNSGKAFTSADLVAGTAVNIEAITSLKLAPIGG